MPDDYNISYSFQLGSSTPAPQASAGDELFAFTNCATIDLGDGSMLIINRDNGRQLTVAAQVVTALTYCGTFRTLEDHAQLLVDKLPQLQGQLNDALKVLTQVRDGGVLLSAKTITGRLNDRPVTNGPLAPTRVFILTCDRPTALARLLDTLLANDSLTVHDELFLVDDSRRADCAEKNRELVAKFNCHSAKSMHYVGATAQQQIAQRLVAALPDDEAAIRFLIDRERWADHKSYGLGRTMCLLLSVGYRCIVLDDDILCRAVLPPAKESGISFGGGSNRELACFDSQQSLMQHASYADFDPLAGHASCLGMNLAPAMAALGKTRGYAAISEQNLRDTNAAMLNTLWADSPILVTQCGSWGDPGVPGCSWFAHLDNASVERILACSGGLNAAIENRHYWLGRPRPNVSKMAVMSQATGLDNSHLLPPYFPAFRGEDYLFASMLLFTHPKSVVLDYDWCVPHLPMEARSGGRPEETGMERGELGLCARYIADQVDFSARGCAQTRLEQLALLLRQLSEQDSAALRSIYRETLARQQAGELLRLDTQIAGSPASQNDEWKRYLQNSRGALYEALNKPPQPMGTSTGTATQSQEELLALSSEWIREFSGALNAWPRMREAAIQETQAALGSELFKA